MLRNVMSFDLGKDLLKIEDRLAEFEVLLQEYECRASDIVSDSVIRSILMNAVPEPLKTHLKVCASQFT